METSDISLIWCEAEGQDSGIHQQASAVSQTAVHLESMGGVPVVQQQAPASPHPVAATNTDCTFRQPLPPALARPRLPSQGNNVVIRSPTGVRHPLQGLDPRLQVLFHKPGILQSLWGTSGMHIQKPWPQSTSELYRPSDHHLSSGLNKLATCFHCFILLSLLDSRDTGEIFLRKFGWLSTQYTVLYAQGGTLHNHCCENLRSYILQVLVH
jgi:hypothetical protein